MKIKVFGSFPTQKTAIFPVASALQLLLAARADFQHGGPGKITALAGAAAWASAATVKTILDAGCLGEGEMCHGQKLDMIDMIGTFVYVRLYIYIYK